MSEYVGSWKIDDLLTFTVTTHRVDTGAATDADSVPTYRVYEDETGTPILTGSMALLDSANTAGFYSEQITLSAANGFEKGKSYNIYIAATVNTVVGATEKCFQVEAEVDANTVSGTVAAVTTVTTVTNLTNAPTNGDFTAAMKTSLSAATPAVTVSDKTGFSLSNGGVDALYTRALTESYGADGAAPTVAQALFEILQRLTEFAIVGTTITVKKLDGSTSAFTLTLDDATTPTSSTRAT